MVELEPGVSSLLVLVSFGEEVAFLGSHPASTNPKCARSFSSTQFDRRDDDFLGARTARSSLRPGVAACGRPSRAYFVLPLLEESEGSAVLLAISDLGSTSPLVSWAWSTTFGLI